MVKTKYGYMEGLSYEDYIEYRKVPYAKPPVGELRFRKPEKPEPWEGVLRAVTYAPCCMQDNNRAGEPWAKDFYAGGEYIRPMSEDCLYLNIWTPKANHDKCPVALWIHGGAFLGGYATESEFDGAEYARRGVILVSVEYRCNIFGFLAHPWLSEEEEKRSGKALSGNYGIYDQLAAIDWIRENIGAFGGDPDCLTIFGQSAGAMSVQTLISSPLCRGKIARAILQSGGSYGIGLHRDLTLLEAEHYGEILTEMLDVHNLEEFRQVPAEKLNEILGPFMGRVMEEDPAGLFLIPVIDGELLTDGYYSLMDQAKLLKIPYMVGWTKDDIDVMAPDRAGSATNTKPTMLAEGSIRFSRKLEETGLKGAYVYSFDRELPGDGWGAYHSAELFYMFGTLHRCWRPWEESDDILSRKMLDYWTAFMKNGKPEVPGLPEWKLCTREDEQIMSFR